MFEFNSGSTRVCGKEKVSYEYKGRILHAERHDHRVTYSYTPSCETEHLYILCPLDR